MLITCYQTEISLKSNIKKWPSQKMTENFLSNFFHKILTKIENVLTNILKLILNQSIVDIKQ